MRNKWKFLTTSIVAAFLLNVSCSGTAVADNLDTYRNLLQKKVYTIKYSNITPEPRKTNKDKVTLLGSNNMETEKIDQLTYKPTESVVVSDGNKRYEEVGTNQFKTCRLQNGDDTYVFTKLNDQGKVSWFGHKKGEVIAGQTNYLSAAMQGDSFGNGTVTRLLNACLPNEQKEKDMLRYSKVGEGWLGNGLNYIDYRSAGSGYLEAIRYYFNGYTLVKIASGMYTLNASGEIVNGWRNIIKINEFSPVADASYLKLPEGLTDKTKREKKTAGEDEKK